MTQKYTKPPIAQLKKELSALSYEVTQHGATEAPFLNKYNAHFAQGIYVDIISGEPLFSSTDKFESHCGWPSFTQAITENAILTKADTTLGMNRIEVKSAIADSHLGHVFDDGPQERGGKRFCINSAAITFIPKSELAAKGYAQFQKLFTT